jgi:hypothetical protein
MGTAALSERDYVHWAIDRADLIIAVGHDTVEKPPFLMGPNGPTVLHVAYLPATVEEVYFPHAELVGDVGPSLGLLADRLEGRLPNAGALLALREKILARIADRAEESRYPLTPQRLVHDVRQAMPEDGVVCLDNGMYDRDRGLRARLRAEMATAPRQDRYVMSQISCEHRGFIVPMRWRPAGGDLSRPNHADRRVDRPSIRSTQRPRYLLHPSRLCAHSCRSPRAGVAPTITAGAKIKSP